MAEICVVIYLNCDPEDIPHWCLWTTDDYGSELIFEALGSTGQAFRFNSRSVRMLTSKSDKEKIPIGRIEADVWSQTHDLLKGVPMKTQAGWNCQDWVAEAIEALKEAGFLERNESGLSYVQRKYHKTRGTYQ